MMRLPTFDSLIQQCRFEAFRGSGPGGQHRNKTSSGVRVLHLASGLTAVATEKRSQHLNRRVAVRRLRRHLATQVRQTLDLAVFDASDLPPDWTQRSPANDEYDDLAAVALDVLDAAGGSVSQTAGCLQVPLNALTRFLAADAEVWAATATVRRRYDLRPLKRPGA